MYFFRLRIWQLKRCAKRILISNRQSCNFSSSPRKKHEFVAFCRKSFFFLPNNITTFFLHPSKSQRPIIVAACWMYFLRYWDGSLHFNFRFIFSKNFFRQKEVCFLKSDTTKVDPPPFQRELNFQPPQQFLSPKNEGKKIPAELGGIKNGLPPYCFPSFCWVYFFLERKSFFSMPQMWETAVWAGPSNKKGKKVGFCVIFSR